MGNQKALGRYNHIWYSHNQFLMQILSTGSSTTASSGPVFEGYPDPALTLFSLIFMTLERLTTFSSLTFKICQAEKVM